MKGTLFSFLLKLKNKKKNIFTNFKLYLKDKLISIFILKVKIILIPEITI